MLREVLAHPPRAVVMCFGDDAAEYRVELYDGYHADRTDPLPDGLDQQWERAPDLYRALGRRGRRRARVRGRRPAGLLCARGAARRRQRPDLTGDRDLYQCASACTVLYVKTGARGAEVVDAREVKRRYGVPPELVPDFIALRGDPSDGIPGAPGIGEKTAASLLARHGSLEGAIKEALTESPRVRGSLRDNAEQLRAFKEMATLRDLGVKRPRDRATDFAGGARAASSLGMNQLSRRLEQLAKPS